MKAPRAPDGLDKAGKRLWRRLVSAEFEYRGDELTLLEEACRTADNLAAIRESGGAPKEERLQQEQLRKLLLSVKWPESEADDSRNGSEWGTYMARRRWSKGA